MDETTFTVLWIIAGLTVLLHVNNLILLKRIKSAREEIPTSMRARDLPERVLDAEREVDITKALVILMLIVNLLATLVWLSQ